jgi:hypothetical protein
MIHPDGEIPEIILLMARWGNIMWLAMLCVVTMLVATSSAFDPVPIDPAAADGATHATLHGTCTERASLRHCQTRGMAVASVADHA